MRPSQDNFNYIERSPAIGEVEEIYSPVFCNVYVVTSSEIAAKPTLTQHICFTIIPQLKFAYFWQSLRKLLV